MLQCKMLVGLIYLKNKHLSPQHSDSVEVPITDVGGTSIRPLRWSWSIGSSGGSYRRDPGFGWSGFGSGGDTVGNSGDDVR